VIGGGASAVVFTETSALRVMNQGEVGGMKNLKKGRKLAASLSRLVRNTRFALSTEAREARALQGLKVSSCSFGVQSPEKK
jgi:hypothetical protein